MSEEQRESDVLRVLMELMSSTANGARLNGERSGFFQMFDAKPDESSEPEIHENRFGVQRAREFLGERMKAGLRGDRGGSVACTRVDSTPQVTWEADLPRPDPKLPTSWNK